MACGASETSKWCSLCDQGILKSTASTLTEGDSLHSRTPPPPGPKSPLAEPVVDDRANSRKHSVNIVRIFGISLLVLFFRGGEPSSEGRRWKEWWRGGRDLDAFPLLSSLLPSLSFLILFSSVDSPCKPSCVYVWMCMLFAQRPTGRTPTNGLLCNDSAADSVCASRNRFRTGRAAKHPIQ